MKKRFTNDFIILITIINLSSLGTMLYLRMSDGNNFDRAKWQKQRFEKVKRELNLTETQVAQFNKIKKDFHIRLDSLDERYELLRKELINSISHDSAENPKTELILKEFGELQNETQRWIVKHFYRFKAVLTPAQSEKFFAILMHRFQDDPMNPPMNRMPGNH